MNRDTYNDRPALAAYTGVFLVLMVLFGVGISLDGASYRRLFHEGGIVEVLSAVLYFVLIALMLLRAGRRYLVEKHYIVMLILFFGLRELDFDKRFTTMGIFKSRFFSSPEVPVIEKLIGGLVIAGLLYIVYKILRNHLIPFLKATPRCAATTVGMWLVLLMLAFSKGIDGLDRKLRGFGVEISYLFTDNAAALEETIELGIPLVMLIAAHAYFRMARLPDRI